MCSLRQVKPNFPVLQSRRILALIRLRRRRIEKTLEYAVYLISPLWAAWPVTIVIALLTLCFLIPGFASDQTTEAILGYIDFAKLDLVIWSKYLITSCLG